MGVTLDSLDAKKQQDVKEFLEAMQEFKRMQDAMAFATQNEVISGGATTAPPVSETTLSEPVDFHNEGSFNFQQDLKNESGELRLNIDQPDTSEESVSVFSNSRGVEEAPKKSNVIPFPTKNYTDQTPVAQIDIMEMKAESKDEDIMSRLSKMDLPFFDKASASVYARQSVVDDCKESAHSERTNVIADCDILYVQNKFTDADGKSKDYKSAVVPLRMGTTFLDNMSMDNRSKNLDSLREEISCAVYKFYGSFERISELYIVDDQLIINGVAFVPNIEGIEEIASNLPLDTYEYVINGRLAPLFDWGYLLEMQNLRILSIPTYEFANDFIAPDLGHLHFRVPYMFSKLRRLDKLCIASEVINRDNPNEESTKHNGRKKREVVEDGLKRASKYKDCYSGFNWNLFTATNGAQSFFVNSLVDYARNRNNKGIIRYSLGVIARTLGATSATVMNAGAHAIWGTLKVIKNIIKDSITPVDEL